MLDDQFYSHLDISFALMENNWYLTEEEGRFKKKTFPAKKCELKDFDHEGIKSNSKKLFDSFAGITILCPDFHSQNEEDLVLYGDTGSMKS